MSYHNSSSTICMTRWQW